MDVVGNFIATDHIYIDISVTSAQISVEYSLLHVPCPHGYFCVHMALFGSKLREPFINVQTHIHTYIQHLANYSKMIL